MQGHLSRVGKYQMGCAQNDLLLPLAEVLEAKAEFPGHEALLRLHHLPGDHKAGLLQRLKHVRKDVPDGGHTGDVVERVLEARVLRVIARHVGHALRIQRFKIAGQARGGGSAVGGCRG